MATDQGPCKKQRTMLISRDDETGEDSTEGNDSTSSENASKMETVSMGPEGDMIKDQIRGQHIVFSKASRSGDGPFFPDGQQSGCSSSLDDPKCVSTITTQTSSSKRDSGPVKISGTKTTSRVCSDSYSLMQNSTAIAENAYIKNKECEKLSGGREHSRFDSVKAGTSTSDTVLMSHQNALSEDDSAESNQIIAFDRADFEFDFYGRGTRQEEDGTLISSPDLLSDTGFIEMFSNSVMGSVLHAPGTETQTLGISSGVWSKTRRFSGATSDPLLESVKQCNVPFVLDSEYMISVVNQQNINSLPQSLLVHIFKSLSPCRLLRKASLVCKYWYNVCRDPDLWREISLRNQYKLSDAALVQLLEFSDRVLKVNLTDCRFVTDAGVHRLVSRCQHIQELKLMRCFDLTDSSFTGIGSQGWCKQLRTLYLDGCCRITDNTAVEISEACPNIQSLHLNQCTKITDVGVMALAQHCHHISHLLLDHCAKVTDKGLSELVLGCPNITYLNIMSCGVTDTGIKMLSKLQHLTNLDVSNIPLMTPASVVYVSRYCKKLDCINISLNSVIDDSCVSELARNLPSLVRLYCVSCTVTDKGLADIACHRPTLEALDVGWCQDVTDQGVRVISHACRKLDYFGLIRCDKVTVETIEELVLKYPTVNYSTFILESKRLLERARREGYQFGL